MAARTLASTWKQYERAYKRYTQAQGSRAREIEALNSLARRVNRSRVVDALAMLFVHPYAGLEETSVRFLDAGDVEELPSWPVRYVAEENVLVINPVGIFRFREECERAVDLVRTREGREDFAGYRYLAYLAELRKLPSRLFLFLLLLSEVANARRISQVEKKGGQIETADDEDYIHLLWGFKELEQFYAASRGADLRTEYGILWYESEWFVGR